MRDLAWLVCEALFEGIERVSTGERDSDREIRIRSQTHVAFSRMMAIALRGVPRRSGYAHVRPRRDAMRLSWV